jgi:hypothetical protein
LNPHPAQSAVLFHSHFCVIQVLMPSSINWLQHHWLQRHNTRGKSSAHY